LARQKSPRWLMHAIQQRHAKGQVRLVWIVPFRQISGKGQFLSPAGPGYGRKKSTAITRKCLIFLTRR
jgi:hypothetical protein